MQLVCSETQQFRFTLCKNACSNMQSLLQIETSLFSIVVVTRHCRSYVPFIRFKLVTVKLPVMVHLLVSLLLGIALCLSCCACKTSDKVGRRNMNEVDPRPSSNEC